jgi:ABC-type protease/lipase transport system fused ATPase/permease subunit
MMTLFTSLYFFFLLLLSFGAIFILYHLIRYSLDKTLGLMGAIFFSVIFCILVVTNIASFRQINFTKTFDGFNQQELLPQSKFAPNTKVSPSSNPW